MMGTPIEFKSSFNGSSIAQGGAQRNREDYPERRTDSRVSLVIADRQLLTERESEVLKYLGEGLPKKSIAQRLALSLSTINTHAENLFLKLGAHNATHAVVVAMCRGIITQSKSDNVKGFTKTVCAVFFIGILNFQFNPADLHDEERDPLRNNRRTNTMRVTSAKTRTEYAQ